jgi:hypothetical protein
MLARRWLDHEGPPLRARQEPARRAQKQTVDGCHCWSIGSSTQDAELVAKHHDLQLLEVTRATEEHDQLKNAAEQDVRQRNKDDASNSPRSGSLLF